MLPNAVRSQLLNGANSRAPLMAALAFVAGYWLCSSDWKKDQHYRESRSFTQKEHEREHDRHHGKGYER